MRLRWLLPLLGLLLLVQSPGWGQSTECYLRGDRFSRIAMGTDTLIVAHNAFTVTCDDGMEVRADSGQANTTTGDLKLVGNVFFTDPAQTLTADEADYSRQTARLHARGNVHLQNRAEGTTLMGPELEYYRANEQREVALVYATLRPTLIMEPRDSVGNPRGSPLTLIGDRVNIIGNDDLTAVGSVLITQDDLTASAEEARYDAATESLELRENALITREGSSISGEVVQARMTEGSLQHVQSRTAARLEGEDLTVAAPEIQLFFERDSLQQVVARVPPEVEGGRARAVSRTFRTEADSIDARFMDGTLNVVYAIGAARGETIDTTMAGAETLEMAPLPEVQPGAIPGLSVDPSVATPGDAVEASEDEPPVAPGGRAPVAMQDSVGPAGETPPPSTEQIAAIISSDWIRGDTIIALFTTPDSSGETGDGVEPVEGAPADPDAAAAVPAPSDCQAEPCPPSPAPSGERETPQLRKLIAQREAQSFYRVASDNPATPDCRNLSFLVGDEIELDVVDGELEVATVRGLEQGLYLEANNCVASPAPADEPGGEGDGTTPEGDDTPEPAAASPLLETAMIHSRE